MVQGWQGLIAQESIFIVARAPHALDVGYQTEAFSAAHVIMYAILITVVSFLSHDDTMKRLMEGDSVLDAHQQKVLQLLGKQRLNSSN
jgi:hypothetical protein